MAVILWNRVAMRHARRGGRTGRVQHAVRLHHALSSPPACLGPLILAWFVQHCQVVLGNPKTAGVARWIFLALWGHKMKKGDAAALDYVTKVHMCLYVHALSLLVWVCACLCMWVCRRVCHT